VKNGSQNRLPTLVSDNDVMLGYLEEKKLQSTINGSNKVIYELTLNSQRSWRQDVKVLEILLWSQLPSSFHLNVKKLKSTSN